MENQNYIPLKKNKTNNLALGLVRKKFALCPTITGRLFSPDCNWQIILIWVTADQIPINFLSKFSFKFSFFWIKYSQSYMLSIHSGRKRKAPERKITILLCQKIAKNPISCLLEANNKFFKYLVRKMSDFASLYQKLFRIVNKLLNHNFQFRRNR